jgi:hypothetical protein
MNLQGIGTFSKIHILKKNDERNMLCNWTTISI